MKTTAVSRLRLSLCLEANVEHDEMAHGLHHKAHAFVDKIIEQNPETLKPSFLTMADVDLLLN